MSLRTEFEVKFTDIDLDDIRKKIKDLGWHCVQDRTLMKRMVFHNPLNKNSYLRLRDEWTRVTCTYKEISDWDLNISSVSEIETEVCSFQAMLDIFNKLWIKQKAFQETWREVWSVDNEIQIMIDERPWIQPFIEIEWFSDTIVEEYATKLWLNMKDWIFGTVDQLYKKELWIPENIINNLQLISFKNPPKSFNW